MSAADIVRRSYDAFARHDMDGVLGDMHSEIEWHQAQGLPHGGFYKGLDDVKRNIFDPLDRDWWSEFAADPEEFVDGGDPGGGDRQVPRRRQKDRETARRPRSCTSGPCATRKR